MIRRFVLPILAHLAMLPVTLFNLAFNAITDPDPHRRGDAALILVVVLLVIGWAFGVFKE